MRTLRCTQHRAYSALSGKTVTLRSSRSRCVSAKATGDLPAPDRRDFLTAAIGSIIWGSTAMAAGATDFKDALAKKQARKAALKAAAGDIKSSGKDQQVFKSPNYSVSEEARTPNIHTRQNEGARTQENV
eukprot:jgi/Chrzof1/12066/Cz06g20050.t1